MNKEEFAKLFIVIKATYPNNKVLEEPETKNVWYELLKDLDYGTSSKVVKEYIQNNVFPPTIADIRKGCKKEEQAFADTWDVAWTKVMKAISKYGARGATEAMNSLDDLTRKAVKSIGFTEICTSTSTSYLKNEFKEVYKRYQEEYDSKVQSSSGIRRIEGD